MRVDQVNGTGPVRSSSTDPYDLDLHIDIHSGAGVNFHENGTASTTCRGTCDSCGVTCLGTCDCGFFVGA